MATEAQESVYRTFLDYKRAFIQKHSRADWTVETSPMRQDGTYVKTYVFSDGSVMTEVNHPVWRTAEAEVEVEGVKVLLKQDVKLFETEAWNTDNAMSFKWYEKF